MYADESVQRQWDHEEFATWAKVRSLAKRVFTEDRVALITAVAFNLAVTGLVFVSLYQAIENATVTGF